MDEVSSRKKPFRVHLGMERELSLSELLKSSQDPIVGWVIGIINPARFERGTESPLGVVLPSGGVRSQRR